MINRPKAPSRGTLSPMDLSLGFSPQALPGDPTPPRRSKSSKSPAAGPRMNSWALATKQWHEKHPGQNPIAAMKNPKSRASIRRLASQIAKANAKPR